jgi:hypothetical protein
MLEIPTFLIILAAGVISFISMPLVIKIAYKLGAVDKPEARKVHQHTMPRLGGLAMYLSFMICIILFVGAQGPFTGLLLGASIVFSVGMLDDIFQLSPWVKLLGQCAAAVVAMYFGVVVEFLTNPFDGMLNLGYFSLPLTFLWIVGVSNAINLIDGLDGLAGGVSAIAAYGINSAPVYRRPRVNVLAMGRNVVAPRTNPQTGQTRDVNSPLLGALIQRDGGVLGSALLASNKDVPEIAASLEFLLNDSDLLITSGGTYTRGDDNLLRVLEQKGMQMVFWGVNLMPGSHCGLARRGKQFILLLSGNPTACFVGYNLFASPLLQKMQGLESNLLRQNALCLNGFNKKSGSRRFVRAKLYSSEQGWVVEVLPGQKPSMIRSMLECNALIDVPAGSLGLGAGEQVSVIPLYRSTEVRNLLNNTEK